MIKGQIVIKLSDGSNIIYANKYLAKKEGDDGAKPEPNLKFAGYPEFSYYYTGFGDDTYELQTGEGKIKGDYDFLTSQIDVAGNEYLKFPESEDGKATNAKETATDTLVRSTTSTINSGVTKRRTKVYINEIVSINVKEEWVNFPYGRESGYNLPKSDPNFYGFQETKERKERGADRGPDFNKCIKTWNGYVPMPTIKYNYDGTFYVLNKDDFSKIVVRDGNVYGIIYVEYNGDIKEKKSASVFAPGEMVDGPKKEPAPAPEVKPAPVKTVKKTTTKKEPVKAEEPVKAPEPKIVKQDIKVSMMEDKKPEAELEPIDNKPVDTKAKKTK